MKPLPLRATLTLVYAGVLAVILTAEGFAYHATLKNQFQNSVTADLEDRARALHGYMAFDHGEVALNYDQGDADEAAFIAEATRFFQVYDVSSGRLLRQSPGMAALGLNFTAAEVAEFRGPSGIRDVQTDRGRLRITSTVIHPPAGGVYLVQVGALLDRLDTSLEEFDRVLVMRTAGGVLLAALMGFVFSGWALAPLRRLASDATGIEISNLGARLPVRGAGDELDHVTVAFNQALARLERSVSEMRQFSAAVAHELRTPLAILRGEAEMALARPFSVNEARELLASQLDEYDRLARLINQILMLARAEAGEISMTRVPLDLSALARAVGDQVDALADAKDIILAQSIEDEVHVVGDAGWLERLMLILLDNAIKFSARHSQVTLRLARDHDRALLSVEDSGVGIDPGVIERVFDPFYRADASQTRQTEGAGIGLALARWIAVSHGATLSVTSTPSRGSTFTLSIATADAL